VSSADSPNLNRTDKSTLIAALSDHEYIKLTPTMHSKRDDCLVASAVPTSDSPVVIIRNFRI
jgi:hypothetical protein